MTWTIYYTGQTQPEVQIDILKTVRFYHMPTIRITYEHTSSFRKVEAYLKQSAWIVFFSKNGVRGFHYWLTELGQSLSRFTTTIWTVGEATGRAVERIFHQTPQQPQKSSAIGLIQAFQRQKKHPLLLIAGQRSRLEFPTWLRQEGWDFMQVPVYRTELYENIALRQEFQNIEEEVVIFTAPSTVQGFLKSVAIPDLSNIIARLISIGPTTTEEVKSLGGQVSYEAPIPSVSHIITTLVSDTVFTAQNFG